MRVFGLLALSYLPLAYSWGYGPNDGPGTAAWGGACASGNAQSPIDFPGWRDLSHRHDWTPLRFEEYYETPKRTRLSNNGHTAVLTLEMRQWDKIPQMSGGGLRDNYEFAQLHFHWGSEDYQGSEHTIEGWSYPLELHLVHYNMRYGRSLNVALSNGNGAHDTLAVLGVFFEISDNDNPKLDHLISGLRFIRDENDYTYTEQYPLRDLLPSNLDRFYRYLGSLTTPQCNEVVTWTVLKDTNYISRRQLERFRQLTFQGAAGDEDLVDNFRPTQPINNRDIIYADTGLTNDKCWDGGIWKESAYIRWRESWDEYSFLGAIHHCLGDDLDYGPYIGLLPVGKIRHFRNNFEYHNDVRYGRDFSFCKGRVYRVNAIKDHDGTWRQYPCGQKVDFHHYPEFQPEEGHTGDSIIWDSYSNRLLIVDHEKHYHALCYRERRDDCHHCAGFDAGAECSDAGDCVHGECKCDDGFRGYRCHIPPRPDFDVLMIAGDNANSNTESYNILSGTSCAIPSYYAYAHVEEHLEGGYIFGSAVVCLGREVGGHDIDSCNRFNQHTQAWEPIQHVDEPRLRSASGIITRRGQDKYFWLGGGRFANQQLITTELLTDDFTWTDGPDLPEPLADHCMIQINDCEAAVIGGITGSDFNGDSTDQIYIYNWHTRTWRDGPSLIQDRYQHACGRVIDPDSGHPLIVIACGKEIGHANPVPSVEVWDTVSNDVYIIEHECPTDIKGSLFTNLNDQELAMVNYQHATDQTFYTFTLDLGFEAIGNTLAMHHDGAVAVVPRHYANCGS